MDMQDLDIFEANIAGLKIEKRYKDKVQAKCPCHDDKKASLTVTKGKKCTLFHCHAGCNTESILQALGIEMKDTFYMKEIQNNANWKNYVEKRAGKRIESTYDYVSYNDNLYAFTKVRLEGKNLVFGILRDERFIYGLGGRGKKDFKAVYGDLQHIIDAIKNGQPVFIPEGEKDVNTLAQNGYAAFTYGGVNDWQSEFAELVRDAEVYILADNDQAGKKVAEAILKDVQGVAKSAKIIVPMPDTPKADITDFFSDGHSKKEFENMLRDAVTEKSADNEKQQEINRAQFHHITDTGRITGVYHSAIFEHIKSAYHILIVGGTPYIYDNGYYKADVTGARLKSIIRELIYPQFIKSTTINNIYALFLQDISLEMQFEQLNCYPSHWICFQNGMYDTKEKSLLPHSPKYRAINQVPHKYKPDAKTFGRKIDEYLEFICEDPDDREMLLQFIGYSLTKDVGQQKFLVLNGEGGTGKSTVIRLIETLTGSRNISNISLTDLQQRFASFGLMGKLLNSCADLEISALEDTSIIKKILGEDTLRAEQKGRDAISFKSYAKLIFSTNELPLVKSEKTNGFYRRLLVLTMNKVPTRKNPNLFQELVQEIDHFLNLAVQAVERMYQQGIIVTSVSSEKAVQQLRADSDTVEAFLQEMCVKDEKGRIERAELYKKYSNYCEDTDRQSLTKNNFYKSLRVKGYSEIKTGGYPHFVGISFLKSSPNFPSKVPLDSFMSVTQEQLDEIPFR